MQITTKRNIGDTIWVIANDKARKIEIGTIHVFIDGDDKISESYWEKGKVVSYYTDQCFDSKDDLIKSIFNEE